MRLHTLTVLVASIWFLTASPCWAREWTDSTGKFSVEAELVKVQEDSVLLKRTDGLVIKVPINRLSKDDRVYVAQQRILTKFDDDDTMREGKAAAAAIAAVKARKPQEPAKELLSHHQALSFVSGKEEVLFDVTTNKPLVFGRGGTYRFSITLLEVLIKFGRMRNSPESDAQLAAQSKLDLPNTVLRSSIDGITGKFSVPSTNAKEPKLGRPFYLDVQVSDACAIGPADLEVVVPTYFVETENRLYLTIKFKAQIN